MYAAFGEMAQSQTSLPCFEHPLGICRSSSTAETCQRACGPAANCSGRIPPCRLLLGRHVRRRRCTGQRGAPALQLRIFHLSARVSVLKMKSKESVEGAENRIPPPPPPPGPPRPRPLPFEDTLSALARAVHLCAAFLRCRLAAFPCGLAVQLLQYFLN